MTGFDSKSTARDSPRDSDLPTFSVRRPIHKKADTSKVNTMGGFQSREQQTRDDVAPTVAMLLQKPGLTVKIAGTTEQISTHFKERFEASISGGSVTIDHGDEPTKKKAKTEEDTQASHPPPTALSMKSKLPPNTEIVDQNLFASGVPITRESVDALVALGVRTFVSFTVMPLDSPRAFHVNLSDFNNPGFADRDPDMLHGLFSDYKCAAVHMPVNDAGTLTSRQVQELVQICKEAREKDEVVLLHCWAGSRRTWFGARAVKRALDGISGDDINKLVRGKEARSNDCVDEFLCGPNFPAAPSEAKERLQLLALAAALQAVTGGGGLYSVRTKKSHNQEAAIMFRAYWPSIARGLDDSLDTTTLAEAMEEIENAYGISASKSRAFPRELQSGWKDFADVVLLRACSDDKDLAASIMEELKKRGPDDVRDEINGTGSGFMQDKF